MGAGAGRPVRARSPSPSEVNTDWYQSPSQRQDELEILKGGQELWETPSSRHELVGLEGGGLHVQARQVSVWAACGSL